MFYFLLFCFLGFSPDLDDCEEYQKVHKEYAQLVSVMFVVVVYRL